VKAMMKLNRDVGRDGDPSYSIWVCVIEDESYTVASQVQWFLNNPEHSDGVSETSDVANTIRRKFDGEER